MAYDVSGNNGKTNTHNLFVSCLLGVCVMVHKEVTTFENVHTENRVNSIFFLLTLFCRLLLLLLLFFSLFFGTRSIQSVECVFLIHVSFIFALKCLSAIRARLGKQFFVCWG